MSFLRKDKSLKKASRDRLGFIHLPGDARDVDIAAALCTIREMGSNFPPQAQDVRLSLEAFLRSEGHDPGETAESADNLAERLRLRCWVEEGDTPADCTILLGGLDWDRILPWIESKQAEQPHTGLFFLTAPRVTAWSWYLDWVGREHGSGVREQMEKARTVRKRPLSRPVRLRHL